MLYIYTTYLTYFIHTHGHWHHSEIIRSASVSFKLRRNAVEWTGNFSMKQRLFAVTQNKRV